MTRLWILAIAMSLWLKPAFAAGGGETKPQPAPGQHPDSAVINARNPAVIHAGPGTPMVGTIHVAPSAANDKGKKKP
jgi:hypothetical protein